MDYLDALVTWGDRLRKQEGRRFYIEQSDCNLVEFRGGIQGVWAGKTLYSVEKQKMGRTSVSIGVLLER